MLRISRGSSFRYNATMKTILVADDEPMIRRLIQVNLEQAGYRVETAENGQQAWERLQQGGIDLLITDVVMPIMDGLELLETLKKSAEPLASLPILVLAARPNMPPLPVNEGQVATGEIPYLIKPCNPKVLLALVEKLFTSPTSASDVFVGYQYK